MTVSEAAKPGVSEAEVPQTDAQHDGGTTDVAKTDAEATGAEAPGGAGPGGSSDEDQASDTALTGTAAAAARRAGAPERPPLADKAAAPVLVKLPPPFLARVAQVLWVVSLVVGAAAIVYMFIIRQAQLPEIADVIRAVDATRADETYTAASDIVFWSIFAPSVAVIFLQIVFLVSFANRRPNVRWWQFGSVLFQAGVFLLARELVAFGDRGLPLERLMLAQLGLAVLGLLVSVLPPVMRWTARRHDVRNGPVAPTSDTQL